MRFTITNSSKNVIKKIKNKMIEQYLNNDINRYKLKFTKKRFFLAVPVPYPAPAFQLFINNKFHKTYFFIKDKWKVL